MPRKKDTIADHLQSLALLTTDPIGRALYPPDDRRLLGSAFDQASRFHDIDWAIPRERQIAAEYALRFDESDVDVQKAFRAFGLNPLNPFDVRRLLALLSGVIFTPQAGRGRRGKWSDDELCQLRNDFVRNKRRFSKIPGGRDAKLEICERLKNDPWCRGRYSKLSATTIKRKLCDAQVLARYQCHRAVRDMGESFIAALRVKSKKEGKKLGARWATRFHSHVAHMADEAVYRLWEGSLKSENRPSDDVVAKLMGNAA